ncbi:PLD nuclease N-terminal domain-containing protein [Kitasatospora sp. GAS1066B]|uniref:PLD nuclease N-terminal domain-containing protein n=1 Tax=Kitasatospora sp. GAS1066B TaxID=3156271 RepID=UPI003515C4B9
MPVSIGYPIAWPGQQGPPQPARRRPGRRPALGEIATVLDIVPVLLVLVLWIWAFIDCLTTPEHEVRLLPKVVWILIILFFGEVLLGPLAWLLVGRRRGLLPLGPARSAAEPQSPRRPVAPDDDPEFLAALGREMERRRREEPEDGSA